MFVLDSHCDTPSQIMRLRDLGKDNPLAQVDFPKLHAGGVDASFFALYTPASLSMEDATHHATDMLNRLQECLRAHSDSVILATDPDELEINKKQGLVSILIGMENGSPIQQSIPLLQYFFRKGVRYLTLTHNGDNALADSAAEGTRWGGLSPFGREVVREMNRLGMIVDLAHASDKTFYDCLEVSETPVVSTHSCCRALAGHRRNMSDEMLRALRDQGGVIQINFYPVFLSDSFAKTYSRIEDEVDAAENRFIAAPSDMEAVQGWHRMQEKLLAMDRPSYRDVVDHIDHAVSVAGIDHVGIGSDFDGITVAPKGLEDVSKIGVIFEEMRRRGYAEDEIAKVAGGNFLRVFSEVKRLSRAG